MNALVLSLVVLTSASLSAAQLLLDGGFRPDSLINRGAVKTLAVSGENLLVTTDSSVYRLLPSGSLDPNFQPPRVTAKSEGAVRAIGRQSSGKIVIGGQFSEINGVACDEIARLNTDGSVDLTFTKLSDDPDWPGFVLHLSVAKNDNILVLAAGSGFGIGSATLKFHILGRLHPDGMIDKTMRPIGGALATYVTDAQGRFIVGSFDQPSIKRYSPDGEPDPTFASDSPLVRTSEIYVVDWEYILARGAIQDNKGNERSAVAVLNYKTGAVFKLLTQEECPSLTHLVGFLPYLPWTPDPGSAWATAIFLENCLCSGFELRVKALCSDVPAQPAIFEQFDAGTLKGIIGGYLPAPEQKALYVFGTFDSVNGQKADGFVRLRVLEQFALEGPLIERDARGELQMRLLVRADNDAHYALEASADFREWRNVGEAQGSSEFKINDGLFQTRRFFRTRLLE